MLVIFCIKYSVDRITDNPALKLWNQFFVRDLVTVERKISVFSTSVFKCLLRLIEAKSEDAFFVYCSFWEFGFGSRWKCEFKRSTEILFGVRLRFKVWSKFSGQLWKRWAEAQILRRVQQTKVKDKQKNLSGVLWWRWKWMGPSRTTHKGRKIHSYKFTLNGL